MRIKERAVVFLIMALQLYSSCVASHRPAVHSQGEKERKDASEQFIVNNKYDQGSAVTIAHRNKLAHGGNGGDVNGVGQPGGTTNGDGSHSPYVQGGAGMIPLYAAGAGNNRHPHHSGGNCIKSITEPTILRAAQLEAASSLGGPPQPKAASSSGAGWTA
ncbi:hypothetical protein Salat_0831100 [Sesamum alatum]|uniref:Uncharacterized protein n=1 Tax=Sesamum alatum TaxID=300844 RepID=A0AAE1YI81_9LAMI|nr:hypothetical protein Salat_0831100 [Sesamum alatum]